MNKDKIVYVACSAPAGGKSTWVKENGLEKYTLSADDLRCLYTPPTDKGISQKYNKEVWTLLYRLVEIRAKEFITPIIVDCCHTSEKYFNTYATLIQPYGYSVVGIDFRQSLETHLELNRERPSWQHVPEGVVMDMHKKADEFLGNNKKYRIVSPVGAKEMIFDNF